VSDQPCELHFLMLGWLQSCIIQCQVGIALESSRRGIGHESVNLWSVNGDVDDWPHQLSPKSPWSGELGEGFLHRILLWTSVLQSMLPECLLLSG